jgi:hypothetical protein
MPWTVWGFDAEQRAALSEPLTQAQNALSHSIINNPQNFSSYLRQKKITPTINATRFTDRIMTGDALAAPPPVPLIIQPILCPIADQAVLAIEIADGNRNIILAGQHHLIPRSHLVQQNSSQRTELIRVLGELTTRTGREAWDAVTPPSNLTALLVGLSLGVATSRLDQGSTLCLNTLLAHMLAKNFPVSREIGNNEYYLVRDLLAVTKNQRRPNRRILTVWDIADFSSFPLKGTLIARSNEAVFTGRIAPVLQDELQLEAQDRITISLKNKLFSFLEQEKAALSLVDKPQIAKVYKAWVYLDKGRGYGLRMNDRLSFQHNGVTIKGHIVGFFGPELKLTSPRGYEIHEGAIMFIRKGQHATKIGQPFDYDALTFPTAWPPQR